MVHFQIHSSGISIGTIVALLLNLILVEDKKEKTKHNVKLSNSAIIVPVDIPEECIWK